MSVQHRKSETEVFKSQVKRFKEDYLHNLRYTLAAVEGQVTPLVNYTAVSLAVRDQIVDAWQNTNENYIATNQRQVYYLSLEFLIGRLLSNNVINLGMEEVCREALKDTQYTWEETKDYELDAGLGNGGLGRLAACFLDSLATLDLPSMGYGLRYDYGIFRQKIVNGAQIEEPDSWLRYGYPWEFRRPEREVYVQFGGEVKVVDNGCREEWCWLPLERVKGVPYDVPVVGYGAKTVNTLRLWSAMSDNEFDLENFNKGSYVDAVQARVKAENLTRVLYPNDNIDQGKELRLRQQYFFVACTVRDVLRRHISRGNSLRKLPDKVFFQLNDTHPTLVIPELMRLLVDEEHIEWDEAWNITVSCVGYTNHTILPEALEKWTLTRFSRLLPRHIQIIYEINGRFLKLVSYCYPGDIGRLARMSIIEEKPVKAVRMAHLALVGCSKINGVAEIHSDILRTRIFRDFSDLWPEKFCNMTNGITQRRWLLNANPALAKLISEKIGDGWITDLVQLRKLEAFLEDEDFMARYGDIKRQNKVALAELIQDTLEVDVNVDSIFDVQIKRLHEYKRQLLLVLYVIMLYNRLIDNPELDIVPRTFIFSGKAAPGYATAKQVIRLIHAVGEAVNSNPEVRNKLRVVFLPDYRVSLAERIIPAADVSEQISLAGTEASGTGNMKLMLNGAITLGTLDGANVEIRQEVGPENIFIFGMNAQEVQARRTSYSPKEVYYNDIEIQRVVDTIKNNVFSVLSPGTFDIIVKTLLDFGDYYMLLADLRSYSDAQDKVAALYRDQKAWRKMSLLNVARAGKFTSDRTILEYSKQVWNLKPWR